MVLYGPEFPLREDYNYRNFLSEPYNKLFSPFERIPNFGLVSQVPIDPMHCLHLGTMKRLIKFLINESKSCEALERLEKLNAKLVNFKKYLPADFARKFRGLGNFAFFRAAEFRKILLYGLPHFFEYLNHDRFIHIMALHTASRILTDPKLCFVYNDYAKKLFNYFSVQIPNVYSDSEMVFTNHILKHLAYEVMLHGALESFSSYPYENFLFQIKQHLRNGNAPLSQIYNRLHEIKEAGIKKYSRKLAFYEYSLGPEKEVCPELRSYFSQSFEYVQFSTFKLTNSFPNNCCYLFDNFVFFIDLISKTVDENIIFVGRRFLNYKMVPGYPCDSRLLYIYLSSDMSTHLEIQSIDSIDRKAFVMSYDKDSHILLPILHS